MSIPTVNETTILSSTEPREASFIEGASDTISAISNSVFSFISSASSKVVNATTSLASLPSQTATYIYYTLYPPIDTLLSKTDHSKGLNDLQLYQAINSFLDETFLTIPEISEKTKKASKQFLKKRIYQILNASSQRSQKKLILSNVLNDWQDNLQIIQRRVSNDLISGDLNELGIDSSDEIDQFTPLGDESHNRGKVPFLITFESGKKVVYKPRSMHPEKLLVDSREGLLKEVGFGTYGIICKQDTALNNQSYGYAEYLEHDESSNTISTAEQLKQYAEKIVLLDRLCDMLDIADLHYLNIITKNSEPHIIDAEVFFRFPEQATLLLSEGVGPLHVFDASHGLVEQYKGFNTLHLSKELQEELSKHLPEGIIDDLEFGIPKIAFETLGIDIDQIRETCKVSETLSRQVEDVKKNLQSERSRCTILSTSTLNGLLLFLDPSEPETFSIAASSVLNKLEEDNYTLTPKAQSLVLEGLEQDHLHHDVPIFEADINHGLILYHGKVIAESNK